MRSPQGHPCLRKVTLSSRLGNEGQGPEWWDHPTPTPTPNIAPRCLARTSRPLAGSVRREAGSCLVQLYNSVILHLTACVQGLKADKALTLLLLSSSCTLFGRIKITCVPWISRGLKNTIFMHNVRDTHEIDIWKGH